MKDLMLDLETWGNSKDSVIVQIGACYFDRYTGEIGPKVCYNIDAESSIQEGFNVWASTLYWWMTQSNEARQSFVEEPKLHVRTAIEYFNTFAKQAKQIWSHATFDFVILMGHFEKLNIKPNFHYRSARDIRTLTDLANLPNKEYPQVGTNHNALDDCLYQVQYCVDCFNKLKEGS
jgi:hypothetical protein